MPFLVITKYSLVQEGNKNFKTLIFPCTILRSRDMVSNISSLSTNLFALLLLLLLLME